MNVGVRIYVEDWDGDDVILVDRTERASVFGETDPWAKVSALLVELIDDCSHRAATQAMALAEDVANRVEEQ